MSETNTRIFTKTILLLSLVSLLTDVSSEMLYPVMPVYLSHIGFSVVWIGILEGIAEATAGFSKGWFGKYSDMLGRRVPFVRLGYSLSAVAKPLIILFANPIWVLLMRTADRLGKGIRTSSRDAILSSESKPENKGKIFGLHRAADTFGAAVGPAIALILLYFYPENYKLIFLISIIPAIGAVFTTFLLKDKKQLTTSKVKPPGIFSFLSYWNKAGSDFKKLVIGLGAFALINSSDMFLLLIAKHRGMSDSMVITLYIFYNLSYAIFSTPLGYLGDKIGLKRTLVIGLVFFSCTYLGISFANTTVQFLVFFLLYGVYSAATEGISKAWISNMSKKEDTATSIGFFNTIQSMATFISSISAGLIWVYFGPSFTFIISGISALVIAVYLAQIKYKTS